jgi:hypothetical protein
MDLNQGFSDAVRIAFDEAFVSRLIDGNESITGFFNIDLFAGAEKFYQSFKLGNDMNPYEPSNGDLKVDQVDFWKRKSFPLPWVTNIYTFDKMDTPLTSGNVSSDPATEFGAQIADHAFYTCDRFTNKILIEAFTKDIQSSDGRVIKWDKKNIIPYNFNPPSARLDPAQAVQLTAAKINHAVTKLKANGVNGMLLCIGSHAHMEEFRMDERVASSLYNTGNPSMATGANPVPYAGVSAFVSSLLCPKAKSIAGGDVDVDYVYVVAPDYFRVPTNMPWFFDGDTVPAYNFNYVACVKGRYDAIRLEEKACVIIECAAVDNELIPDAVPETPTEPAII